MNRLLSLVLTCAILATVATGCAFKRVVLVPSEGALLRVGPDVKARVYNWTGTEWELSRNRVALPEGWFIGPPPPQVETPLILNK